MHFIPVPVAFVFPTVLPDVHTHTMDGVVVEVAVKDRLCKAFEATFSVLSAPLEAPFVGAAVRPGLDALPVLHVHVPLT